MSLEAWFTIGTIGLVVAIIATNRISVDLAMVGGLTLLLIGDLALPGDVLSVPDAIQGFSHKAILLIGSLFVVAAGLQETGGMEAIAARLLGRPKTAGRAQLRLMFPVAIMSGFMNNTPIVAMYMPIVTDWARKLGMSSSKFLLPLSYASILGGKLTTIGTASNVVVMTMFVGYMVENETMLADRGIEMLSSAEQFWGIAWLGLPVAVAGVLCIALTSRWLLPERREVDQITLDARQYEVEMEVQPEAPIVGRTIEEAGLRQLPGLYLSQIERGDRILAAVGPDERLQAGDRLAFVGVLESVVDLRKIRGLVPATDQVEKVSAERTARTLVEAVVSTNSPLVGKSVRASSFRTTYNAAIIAVHRNGQHLESKIGDIVLQPGDTLLLETHGGFVKAYRNSADFYLVSNVEGFRPIRHERAGFALGILALLVILFTLTRVDQLLAALVCALLMIGTRCLTSRVARNAINWQVLIVIGAALGFGEAIIQTGAADHVAQSMLGLGEMFGFGPTGMLMMTFIIAALFSQLINTSGSAVLMFPIAMATAAELGVSPVPFAFVLMMGAGSAFLSPIAYQTNLMVYGPGGYRFSDFVRVGLPVTLVNGALSVLIAPMVFPFA